jgi:hypothetical protein
MLGGGRHTTQLPWVHIVTESSRTTRARDAGHLEGVISCTHFVLRMRTAAVQHSHAAVHVHGTWNAANQYAWQAAKSGQSQSDACQEVLG